MPTEEVIYYFKGWSEKKNSVCKQLKTVFNVGSVPACSKPEDILAQLQNGGAAKVAAIVFDKNIDINQEGFVRDVLSIDSSMLFVVNDLQKGWRAAKTASGKLAAGVDGVLSKNGTLHMRAVSDAHDIPALKVFSPV